MAFAGCSVEGALPLWCLPPAYEDDRLSWPARQSVRYAGDDPQLEHDRGDHEDSERQPGETCRATRSQSPVAWNAIGVKTPRHANFRVVVDDGASPPSPVYFVTAPIFDNLIVSRILKSSPCAKFMSNFWNKQTFIHI